jgi:hypothetical protein
MILLSSNISDYEIRLRHSDSSSRANVESKQYNKSISDVMIIPRGRQYSKIQCMYVCVCVREREVYCYSRPAVAAIFYAPKGNARTEQSFPLNSNTLKPGTPDMETPLITS